MQLWKRARWPWESLRITLSHGTGFCCKSVPCLLAVTVKWTMKQHCWKSGFNLCVHRLQGSGDCHGHQLDFHCPAAISGWCHGLGHDCSGYSGHWIRYVFSLCRFWNVLFYIETKHYLCLFFLGIFHCYMEFASLKDQPGSDITIRDLGLQTDFAVYLQIRQTWLAFSTDQHTF